MGSKFQGANKLRKNQRFTKKHYNCNLTQSIIYIIEEILYSRRRIYQYNVDDFRCNFLLLPTLYIIDTNKPGNEEKLPTKSLSHLL